MCPNPCGIPGCIATRKKSRSPRRKNAALTTSRSPTLTPPEEMNASAWTRWESTTSFSASTSSRTMPAERRHRARLAERARTACTRSSRGSVRTPASASAGSARRPSRCTDHARPRPHERVRGAGGREQPSSGAWSRRPAGTSGSPAFTSSPAGRMCLPAGRSRRGRARDRRSTSAVLDRHDRVGAGRDRRAGRDPHRLAAADGALGTLPDQRASRRRGARPACCGVASATSEERTANPSIALEANVGDVALGDDVLREHAPERLGERQLERLERLDLRRAPARGPRRRGRAPRRCRDRGRAGRSPWRPVYRRARADRSDSGRR